MGLWVRNRVSKFWPYFQDFSFDFWNGYKIHVISSIMPKFCMRPLNLMQMKAQTRRLRKSQLLISKVGKSKQIWKMVITSVLTMLMSPFSAHFASLDCSNQISKNLDDVISLKEKLKNSPFKSITWKPWKLRMMSSSVDHMGPNSNVCEQYFTERSKLRWIWPSCQIFLGMISINLFFARGIVLRPRAWPYLTHLPTFPLYLRHNWYK